MRTDLTTNQTIIEPVACCGNVSVNTRAICLCLWMFVDYRSKGCFCCSPGERAAVFLQSSLAVQTLPWFLLVELYQDLPALFILLSSICDRMVLGRLYFIILTLVSLRGSKNEFIHKITRIFICSHSNTVTYKTQITSDMDLIV